MNSLHNFLLMPKSENEIIFTNDEHEITFGVLKSNVFRLAQTIQKSEAQNWVINSECPFKFTMGLLALIHCHKSIVLPPNAQKGMLTGLEEYVDGFLLDKKVKLSKEVVLIESNFESSEIKFDLFDEIDPDNISITFFTSGSTGKPKQIKKSLTNLIEEVKVLEEIWGDRIAKSIFFSTVSHQHIYGLLFSLLWPLATSRQIYLETFQYPEELLKKIHTKNQVTLISSPAQLSRMSSLIDLNELSVNQPLIFSSGGPLLAETSLDFEKETKASPIEVFGSSETGGIAWRQRIKEKPLSENWTPLNSVEVSVNEAGVLLVKSTFINEPCNEGWYPTNDLIEIKEDGKFSLKGRNDRIVKIEEKRVSLVDMENRLKEHPFVTDIAVIELINDLSTNQFARKELGAILQLNDEGNFFLEANGRLKIANELKNYLLNYFERILMPRRWRYVASIPQNKQGKKVLSELQKEFNEKTPLKVLLPEILEENKKKNNVNLRLKVSDDLFYLKGHFDDLPIVAGVVQIDWVMKFAEKHFDIEPNIKSMENIKFFNIIQKGEVINLHIEFQNNRIIYEYFNETHKFSSGKITLK